MSEAADNRLRCSDCEHSTIKSPNGVKYAPNHSYCKIGHGDLAWGRLPRSSSSGGPAPKWCPLAKKSPRRSREDWGGEAE